jgi:Holliday junction resolvase RusA-like endonuclease
MTSNGFMGWFRGAAIGSLITLRVDAEPAPVTRIPTRQGKIRHGALYSTYYGECQRQLAVQAVGLDQLSGPLACVVEAVRARPKTTKRRWPTGDADNLAKGITDAATKAGLWVDDDQMISLHCFKRYAEPGETPHTLLHIARVEQ